jgi:hypothetical protein
MSSRDGTSSRTPHVETAARKLEVASQLRDLARRPTAVALAVQRVTTAVNGLIWAGILLGIAFSTANVQRFAAAGAPVFTLQWWTAWLFEPFINLVLIAVLLGQQACARHHVVIDTTWPTTTKWVCFAATFAMNTWTYWNPFDLAGVVLHAIPPGIVLCAAETAPALNAALARAVDAAEHAAHDRTSRGHTTTSGSASVPDAVSGTGKSRPDVQRSPTHPSNSDTRPVRRRRRTRKEIIDEVVSQWQPGTTVDRQWVLQTSGCSEGIATDIADAVRAIVHKHSSPAESASGSVNGEQS